MKRMKCIVSLFLVLAVANVCSVFSFAPTVSAKGSEDDVAVARAFGFYGEEAFARMDSSYPLKRSEFVAMMIHALPYGANFASGTIGFTDVPEDGLYTKEIRQAVGMGLIQNGDGLFRPTDDITVSEATAIWLRLLGYDFYAQKAGGFPSGYLKTASSLGLLDDIAADRHGSLTSETAARMFCNAFDIEIMQLTESNGKVHASKTDGKTFLSEVLDAKKAKGIMKATALNGWLNGGTETLSEDGYVVIDGKKYDAATSGAEKCFGYKTEFYYRETEDSDIEGVILYASPVVSKNDFSIFAEDIEGFSSGSYTYMEGNNTQTTDSVGKNCDVIYNGRCITSSFHQYVPKHGQVSFVDNDNDGNFDVLFITDYESVVVDRVDLSENTIYKKGNFDFVELENDNEKIRFVLEDKRGEKVELRDVAEWSILSVAESDDGKLIRIVLSNDVLTGSVGEFSQEDADGGVVKINGDEYAYISDCGFVPSAGLKGSFCLDAYGRVVCVKTPTGESVGFIIAVSAETGISNKLQVKMLDETGSVLIYDCAQKVLLNSSSYKDGSQLEAALKLASGRDSAEQLVKYGLDADGAISRMETAVPYSDTLNYDSASQFHESVPYKTYYCYKAWAQNFKDDVRTSSNTKVFVIPKDKEKLENYAVYEDGASYFNNGSYYITAAYNMNYDTPYADYMVVFKGTDSSVSIPDDTPITLITGKSKRMNSDEEVGYKFTGLSAGKEISFYMPEDEMFTKYNLAVGDIIRYSADADGEVEAIDKLYDSKSGSMTTTNPSTSDYIAQRRYFCGDVYYYVKDLAAVAFKPVSDVSVRDDVEYIFPDGFKYVYEFDSKTGKARVASQSSIRDYLHNGNDYSKVFVYNWYGDPRALVIFN